MEIKSASEEKEEVKIQRIIGSRHTECYRLSGNRIMKKFKKNNYYQDIKKKHEDFLLYLKYLSSISNEAFIVPDVAYVSRDNEVSSYVRDFVYGTSIAGLYPKTAVAPLMEALRGLYLKIDESPELSLDGVTAKDIVYTGSDIKITDFDLCSFNDKDNVSNNKNMLNLAIFVGLFGIKAINYKELSKEYLSLVSSLTSGEFDIVDYLDEATKTVPKKKDNPVYLKDLQKAIVLK